MFKRIEKEPTNSNHSTRNPYLALIAAIALMFLYDAYNIDECLHLDSDWPAIVCSVVSIVVAIEIGIANLKKER